MPLRADVLFSELCDEIDYWRGRAEQAEKNLAAMRANHSINLTRQLKDSQATSMGLLALALDRAESGNEFSKNIMAGLQKRQEEKEHEDLEREVSPHN